MFPYIVRFFVGMSNRVITLWFRAPELMLGATHYAYEVDMWSAGCVFVEMLTGRPPFMGYTEMEQFKLICEVRSNLSWQTMV